MAGEGFVSTSRVRAEDGWLRRFSLAVAGDEPAAEDAVQDAWLTGLTRPPATTESPGGWLRVVLRNIARKRARSEGRRLARERDVAASAGPAPSPEEVALRAETERLVAELVAALDEPYRSTVQLCYHQGLAPAEVARRLEIPAATVRWRLSRALAIVRAQLDARHEGRRPWRAVLLPVVPRPRRSWTALTRRVTLSGLAAATVASGIVAARIRHAGPAAALSPARATAAPAAPDRRLGRGPRVRLPRFTPAPVARPPAPEEGPAKPATVSPTTKLAMQDLIREVAERVQECSTRFPTLDPAYEKGVQLTVAVDPAGLRDVWLEGRSDVPSGSLRCLSDAVYQTDWSGITEVPFVTMFTIRLQRTDGGPPPP
jgi:RNA polymerase sigma-70 factor (ECF subfamily)